MVTFGGMAPQPNKRKNHPAKAPEGSPKAERVQPWREVKQPRPGTLYAVYSVYSDIGDRSQPDHWNAQRFNSYPFAVYRCPDLGTAIGAANYKKLCEIRMDKGWLGMVFDKDYLSHMCHFELHPRTVTQVFSGELVFFIGGDGLFHRVLKDEEVILLDGSVFQFLLPEDK